MGQHHGTPWLPGGSSVYERKLHGNIHLKSLPQPWEWRDWMAHLDGELNMPNRSCVKADDTHVVPDVALRKSGEFPKLDMRLAKELVKNAEAGCQALYIRIKAVREHRLANPSIVIGREFFRMYVNYFARNVNCDTMYQWMAFVEVTITPGKLEESMTT